VSKTSERHALHANLTRAKGSESTWENNYVTTLPPSVLSGAWKKADKFTVTLETVGNKIRANSQGWEDARVVNERQAFMVVAIDGILYALPEHRPAKFERVDTSGLNEAGYGPEDFA
jgi:hypothetical protein